MKTILKTCLLSAAIALASTAAMAVDFTGKTISIVVPFPNGGGVDLWARFNAPLLGRYLPGKPTVVVKNMPGGGSTSGANFFALTAKPDGMTLLASSASTQFPYLLGDPRVKYDYKDWKIVLAGPTGGAAYVSSKFGAKSIKDIDKLRGKELFFASPGRPRWNSSRFSASAWSISTSITSSALSVAQKDFSASSAANSRSTRRRPPPICVAPPVS